MNRPLISARLIALALLAGCQSERTPSGAAAVPAEAVAALDSATLMRHIRVLAADSLQGRAPGSLGEAKTVAYLEAQFRELGLTPGNPDGSFIQSVPLVGITPQGSPALVLAKGAQRRTLTWRDDFVAWTKHVAPEATLENSELVFVGYGVEAPEFQWDDFKGVDLAGKTLVMLVNDPPLADSTQFGGKAMTYYGRWTYKYEQGMKHRAAGVLIVHETGPAGYPFAVVQGKTGEEFDLVTADKNLQRSAIEGWITLEQARAIMRMAGQNFDALKVRAATREFQPVALGITASLTIRNGLRTLDSRNVVAKLAGRDANRRDEYVVYTAHWDHFGIGAKLNGDSIYNGALDNATGTAGLLDLAKAYAAMKRPPGRSILFLAVTAEEQGLLGSRYYSETPLYPLTKTLAVINMDGLNTGGRTRDLTVVGYGASELDDYAQAAALEQGRVLRADPEPEKGFYYRSDHFNFAKQGVPAFYPGAGVDFIGKAADYGMRQREAYTANDYHKPSDEIKADWDLTGAVEDLRLLLTIGYRVAQAAKFPEWRPGNEFRAIREAQFKP
jgi:Zn-dependent M28 family amino/carboxypeptidase